MRRRTWIAAVCTLALGVAGCGGGGNRLSKADLVKQGDQLCLAQRAADQKIGATRTVKTLAAKGDQLLASDRAALDRFAKLRPPSDLQGDFDSYVTLLRRGPAGPGRAQVERGRAAKADPGAAGRPPAAGRRRPQGRLPVLQPGRRLAGQRPSIHYDGAKLRKRQRFRARGPKRGQERTTWQK